MHTCNSVAAFPSKFYLLYVLCLTLFEKTVWCIAQFIISASTGVNAAMERWGDILLAKYGKSRYAYVDCRRLFRTRIATCFPRHSSRGPFIRTSISACFLPLSQIQA